ncbi:MULTISPECIES: TRAP transporter large permease [unclassified Desulfovibrio]|uniref:TRAP transporter large permease n=1 Tax=unclassified Desulfovibrio TaxID=2593640 RepID=UPI000F5E677B|nr:MULTISPECIES: TRAP transporter large permease [unclassified Desulfovibrio]RRD70773.1 TRAP transporter large permease [Desulfovibrio sp. OH1209_COT-279]RRD87175.1 TRAP transporter large permease [Desulfovibrio sp. OH1186_COT-070]
MEWPIALAAIALVALLILSVPIGVAIGSSVVVAVMAGDLPAEFLLQKLVLSLDSFPLLAVPFFILSGEIMQKGSMAQSLLAFSKCLLGHIRGGLAHVSILTSMFYGALSGSAPATVAAVGGIMIPAMERESYSKDFASAVNTASGCLGVMIPPSVPLIIYGTTANVSVGDLFIGGIFPGIFIGLLLMVTSYIIARRTQTGNKAARAPWRETLTAFSRAKYALVVPVLVLGGIYGGITTPTEAGAIAVTYGFITEGLILKTLTWKDVVDIFKSSCLTTASIFIVVATASALGQLLMIYNIPDLVVQVLSGLTGSKYILLTAIIVLLLIMGTFMDALANILILTPLLQPLVTAAGIDMTHFGIIMIVAVSIGFLTPPVGVNLFVACGISGISIERLSVAVLPFVGVMIVGLLVLAFVPQFSLFLL